MGKFEYTHTFETDDEITGCDVCRFMDVELDCVIDRCWRKNTQEEQFERCPLTKRVRGGDGHFIT